jgi:16S rRNA (uracil1498-N3)-methyltransferase
MTLALFLVDELATGEVIVLDGDEGHHAATVKRVRPGEKVTIGDGRGAVLGATVGKVGRDRVELDVDWRRFDPAPDPRVVVVQALPKGGRAELAVELLTELGVDEVVPWAADNSVVRWDADQAAKGLARWQRTAREAAKQSRRSWLPVVHPLASTAEVNSRLRAAQTALVLHESADSSLGAAPLPATGEVVLVVGPEGGVSAAELDLFADAGAASVRLGVPVLRTSTAGGAALAALSVRLGRWA